MKDSNGNLVSDEDSVIVIKDLEVKGSSKTLRAGTKNKGIRLVDGDHDVGSKMDGMGVMLKSKFLKKARAVPSIGGGDRGLGRDENVPVSPDIS
jgi:protein PhnA